MTQLLVLGLLNKENLSGYDIQNMLRMSDAESWGGVLVGSIYHALKKLEKEQAIKIAAIETTGYRQRAVYTITESGRTLYKKMLLQSMQESSVVYPTTFYAALNFLDDLSAEASLAALTAQQKALSEQLRRLQDGMEEKRSAMGQDYLPISELVYQNMAAQIRQQQDFVAALSAFLEKTEADN